jgi:hypothetical protein
MLQPVTGQRTAEAHGAYLVEVSHPPQGYLDFYSAPRPQRGRGYAPHHHPPKGGSGGAVRDAPALRLLQHCSALRFLAKKRVG